MGVEVGILVGVAVGVKVGRGVREAVGSGSGDGVNFSSAVAPAHADNNKPVPAIDALLINSLLPLPNYTSLKRFL